MDIDQKLKEIYLSLSHEEMQTAEAIEMVFNIYDENKDGNLDIKEVQQFVKDYSKNDPKEEDEIQSVFNEVDADENGLLSKDEMLAFIQKMQESKES